MTTYIHLHGFCSSPGGTKAQFYRRAFADVGIDLIAPDLNRPRFYDLTITRQIEAVRALARDESGPVVLLGSSMGGLVALHYAEQYGDIERLVLFAPALDLAANLRRRHGKALIDTWRRDGELVVPHYGYDRPERVAWALYEDLERYDSFGVENQIPTLIIQGRNDDQCPAEEAVRFAEPREHVRLELFDTDHMMHDRLAAVWEMIRSFLAI